MQFMGNCMKCYICRHSIILYKIMARAKPKAKQSPPKEPQLTQQQKRDLRKKKAYNLADSVSTNIYEQIVAGGLQVSETAKHIKKQEKKEASSKPDIHEKIDSLNHDLQSLEEQIHLQKETERRNDQQKKRAAQELITRLRKQKEVHKNRMKFDEINNRLKYSAVSEDIIKAMKQRKQMIVKEKQKQMQLKIYQNLNRRVHRQEQAIKNEISHWGKVKELQEKKLRHNSTKVLPSIHRYDSMPKNILHHKKRENYQSQKRLGIPRKNSEPSFHLKSHSSHQIDDYHELVNKFLQKAKQRHQIYSDRSPNGRTKVHSSVVKIQFSESDTNQEDNRSQLTKNEPSMIQHPDMLLHQSVAKQRILKMLKNDKRKRMKLGDGYLKESIDVAKKSIEKSQLNQSIAEEEEDVEGDTIFISSKKIDLMQKNIKNMQDKYEKILAKLENRELEKGQAIQMLLSIERRLDKVDPNGIQQRLKAKLQAFDKLKCQPKLTAPQSIQNINISRITEKIQNNGSDVSPQPIKL